MRKLFFLTFLFVISLNLCNNAAKAQNLPRPASGKTMVIFERPPLTAMAVQIRLFDSSTYIGLMGAGGHLVYECSPGKKLFWATAENRDFMEADLAADQVYLVQVEAVAGALTARVKLQPYNPTNKRADKVKKQFAKRIDKGREKKIGAALGDQTPDRTRQIIENGLQRYQTLKQKNKKITQITTDMHI